MFISMGQHAHVGPAKVVASVTFSLTVSTVLGVMSSKRPVAPACNVLLNNLLLNYKVATPAARFVFKASESQLADSTV